MMTKRHTTWMRAGAAALILGLLVYAAGSIPGLVPANVFGFDDHEVQAEGEFGDPDEPGIKVTAPTDGATVDGEITLEGSANVYEGHVSYELWADGEKALDGYTLASMGEWTEFEKVIDLPDDVSGDAVLKVFSLSPKDGSQDYLTEVPLEVADGDDGSDDIGIRVESPVEGSTVDDVIHLAGEANVYEGHVVYELVSNGEIMREGSVTGMMGEWGDFSETIQVPDAAGDDLTLRLYSPSAKDNSEQHLVEIPLQHESDDQDEGDEPAQDIGIRLTQLRVGVSSEVGDAILLQGEANVFEGTVVYELRSDDEVVREGSVMGKMGEWGSFRKTIDIPDELNAPTALRLYAPSPRDGSPQHLIEVPLTSR